MLVFVGGGKPENPEKNPRSKDENQQQTQPTYGTGPKSNPGDIGGRRALSPLRNPYFPVLLETSAHYTFFLFYFFVDVIYKQK